MRIKHRMREKSNCGSCFSSPVGCCCSLSQMVTARTPAMYGVDISCRQGHSLRCIPAEVTFTMFMTMDALKKLSPEERLEALPPPGIPPLVRIHPENGRKALFLNPVRIESIVGMPDDEALDLITELMTHAIQKKYEYRHQWKYGDMVLWDNRSVLHKANPDYDMNERRFLYRLMLKGEAPIAVAA